MLDAFRCHRKPSLLQYVHRQHKTEIAIIPGGMTSILQPLDVGINRPMKSMLKAKWGEWMQNGNKTYTKSGRQRAPDLVTVTEWIVDCWKTLDKQIIVKSFKRCCISNAMDGTEDDILWNEEATCQEEEAQSDDDDLLFNDEDIMSTEQIQQLFMESDD